jgi:hypothetical protein
LREAAGLALKEFEDFLLRRPAAARYRVMTKRVAREPARWAGIKAHLEGETGAGIHDANLANLLGGLLKVGFLRREGLFPFLEALQGLEGMNFAMDGSSTEFWCAKLTNKNVAFPPSFYLTHANLLRI